MTMNERNMADKHEMMVATAGMNREEALAYAKKINASPKLLPIKKADEERIFSFLQSLHCHNSIVTDMVSEVTTAKQGDESESISGLDDIETSGTFTTETKILVDYIQFYAPHDLEDRLTVHGDAKKKKIMVRVDGKLVFKMFVQKGFIKCHLKTEEAWSDIKKDGVFYQNGFNLAYANKLTLPEVKDIFLPTVLDRIITATVNE